MIQELINHIKSIFILPFLVFSGLVMGLLLYAGFSGWKFFGKTTENWSPDGQQHRNGTHRSTHYHRYHK